MAKPMEFMGIEYKEGALDEKMSQLIRFAVNLAINHEHGAKLHLERARQAGATEDEIWETAVYALRPVAAQVRNFARKIIANDPKYGGGREKIHEPEDDRRRRSKFREGSPRAVAPNACGRRFLGAVVRPLPRHRPGAGTAGGGASRRFHSRESQRG